MRNALSAILVASILVFGAAQTHSEKRSAKFKVGVSTALSGPAGTFGDDTRKILQFSFSRFSNELDLIIEDDRCSPKDAVTVAKKLAEIDKVDLVIGPICTGAVLAAAPIYERRGIPTITPNARSSTLTERNSWIIVANPGNGPSVNALLHFLKESYGHLAILSEETDFCEDAANVAIETAKRINLPLRLFSSRFEDDELPSLVSRVTAVAPDALFLNTQTEATFLKVLKILRQRKYAGKIFGLYFPGGTSFRQQVGSEGEGVVFTDFRIPPESDSQELINVYSKFVATAGPLNSNASNFEYTYDLANAAVEALRSGVNSRDYLLSQERQFHGLSKKWRFIGRRRNDGVVVVSEIASGTLKVIRQDPLSDEGDMKG